MVGDRQKRMMTVLEAKVPPQEIAALEQREVEVEKCGSYCSPTHKANRILTHLSSKI